MKNIKRLTALFLVLGFVMCLCPMTFAAEIVEQGTCGKDGDNLTWTLDDEGTLIISGEGEMTDYVSSSMDNDRCPEWGDGAPHHITSVIIEDGVTSIGNYAFENRSNITSITMADSVTSIGDYAFYGCDGLTSIELSKGLKKIGDSAFYFCTSLETLDLPASLESIGKNVFDFTSALTEINADPESEHFSSVDGVLFNKEQTELVYYPVGKENTEYTVPAGVTSIGISAFSLSSNLTKITLPDTMETIGEMAFWHCVKLESINLPEGIREIGDRAFEVCPIKNVSLPQSLESIGELGFYACKFENLILPKNLKTIGDLAFYYSITGSVTVPASVENMGHGVFSGSKDLTEIVVESGNKNYSSADGVLFDKAQTLLISYPAGKTDALYTVPSTVTTIGEYAFDASNNLKSVFLPAGLKVIGGMAFYNCRNLGHIIIPAGVQKIGSQAFNICYSLKTVVIPEGITEIGSSVFSSCDGVTSVYIPASVKLIRERQFSKALKDIYFGGSKAEWDAIDIETDMDSTDPIVHAEVHYNCEIPVLIDGDMNNSGIVDAGDATLILRAAVGDALSDIQLLVADMNGNGIADAADATIVLRITVGA